MSKHWQGTEYSLANLILKKEFVCTGYNIGYTIDLKIVPTSVTNNRVKVVHYL